MKFEDFEVGKRYRCLKDGVGGMLYCGCDVKAGDEFVVSRVNLEDVFTHDVTCDGEVGEWIITGVYTSGWSELFEPVEDDSEETDAHPNAEPSESTLVEDIINLQQSNNLILQIHDGKLIINFEHSDTDYAVSSTEELTELLEAAKVLKQFEK